MQRLINVEANSTLGKQSPSDFHINFYVNCKHCPSIIKVSQRQNDYSNQLARTNYSNLLFVILKIK